MSRPLRIEFPGALYHVTTRGNERRPIVRDDADRKTWLALLEATVRRFQWRLHAWCLMDNHFHLVLTTPQLPLSRGMHYLNGLYAQRFNRRHGRAGHLVQGRYDAKLVDRDAYLLAACRYVVLNPERVERGGARYDEWRWSSYRATAGLAGVPRWLDPAPLLAQFGRDRDEAQRRYCEFVHAGLDAGRPRVTGQIYVGGKDFIRRHGGRAEASPEVPRVQRSPLGCSLDELLRTQEDRAITVAYRDGGYRLREIAAALGVHYSTVSRRLVEQESAERAA